MLGAQFGVHRQPVLQREDAEHRRTVEMTGDDFLGQMSREMLGSTTLFLKHRDIVALGAFRTLLPPETQRRHIVGGDGGDAAIDVTLEMGELETALLRHRLDLEREDTEGIEYRLHTFGEHAEVFCTTEHASVTEHLRETSHSRSTPEHIMTLVIIVVVQPHEGIFLFGGECLVDRFLPGTDTRVVHLRLMGIFEEEHIANQTIEAVTYPQAVLVTLALKRLTHLPLGVVFRLQVVEPVAAGNEEMFFHKADVKSEEPLEHTVVNEWSRKEVLTERQSEIFDLSLCHRQRRREMAEKTEECFVGDLPDAEEAQYVVDADGVEILLHPLDAFPKPSGKWKVESGRRILCCRQTSFLFPLSSFLPFVSGEAPVLSVLREVIWRRACRTVETEEIRMDGRLDAVTIDSDGHISLQDHSVLAGIVGSSL